MTELELFDAVFPELVSLLCDTELKDRDLSPAAEWFQEVCLSSCCFAAEFIYAHKDL